MVKSFVLALARLFCAVGLPQPVYTVHTVAGSNPLGDGAPATKAVVLNRDPENSSAPAT